jgi:small subunit ribosomal protein S20
MGKASSLSTKKRLRESLKRQARNKANRTRLKSEVKKVRLAAGSGQDASKMLSEAYSVIDKSVRKGVISKNAAARHKSRLTKLTNKAS